MCSVLDKIASKCLNECDGVFLYGEERKCIAKFSLLFYHITCAIGL